MEKEKNGNLIKRANRVLSPVLTHATELEIVRGKGIYLYDKEGREYMDFAAGIAATVTGHCHPKVVAATTVQLESLIHACAGVVYYEQNIALAEKLKSITPEGLDMTFFGQSGSEAIETALKLAKYTSKKKNLIAFQGSFHGRTLGALSITFSNPKYRDGYEPLIPGIFLAPYAYCYRCEKKRKSSKPEFKGADFPSPLNCALECLKDTETVITKVKDSNIAAMIVEPIQGEGGYIIPPKEFIKGLRDLCNKHEILLIFDEVQSGFGRTGKMFAAEHYEVAPDIMAVAKAIASGMPLGATIAKEDLMKAWKPGAHGGTMSGNPVTCMAANATIEVIETENLLGNSKNMGRYLKDKLIELQEKCKIIGDVRGVGLMIGVEFIKPGTKDPNPDAVKRIRDLCLEKGLILIGCGSDGQVIRIVPALTVNKEQIDQAFEIFKSAVDSASKGQ
jgi:4-aminobutyrate aminotransferase